ncbi:MAG: GNAT family protein [Sporichthyaceae bacterium]
MSIGWPATLQHGRVGLRPIRQRDRDAWVELRAANLDWLAPWEATPPRPTDRIGFRAMVRALRGSARQGLVLPFVITYDNRLVGQVTVGGITWGSLCSAHVGYWVDSRMAGRGVTPTAVALAGDHAFRVVGLHRLEINVRPENTASLRVVEKLGFRDEGIRRRFLHIAGDWRDHRTFALTTEEVPEGLLNRWLRHSGEPS